RVMSPAATSAAYRSEMEPETEPDMRGAGGAGRCEEVWNAIAALVRQVQGTVWAIRGHAVGQNLVAVYPQRRARAGAKPFSRLRNNWSCNFAMQHTQD